jgi:hypothetical protein
MILYMRTQRTGMPRLAWAAAALAVVLTAWWISEGTPPSGAGSDPPAAAIPRAMPPPAAPPRDAPKPTEAAAAQPAAPPLQYVGQWMEGSRRAVVLSYQGRSVVVRVPGRVDERYEVVSADDRELLLRDIAAATTQRIGLGGPASLPQAPGAPGAAAPATAVDVPAAPAPSGKLPPPSKRTSDDQEPEN